MKPLLDAGFQFVAFVREIAYITKFSAIIMSVHIPGEPLGID
ncbi:MAG: hypothetical protein OEM52_02810 [bacterium]|nr:hypothetical protein [bacterium]